jgi:hypothetical protein
MMIILNPEGFSDLPISNPPAIAMHSKKTLRVLRHDCAMLISP